MEFLQIRKSYIEIVRGLIDGEKEGGQFCFTEDISCLMW